jgi:hypothetical protein
MNEETEEDEEDADEEEDGRDAHDEEAESATRGQQLLGKLRKTLRCNDRREFLKKD